MPVNPVTQEIRQAHMENVLLDAIKRIANPEYQRKAWIEGSLPKVVDCWEETMCQFFDDASIDDLLENIDPKFGWSDKQIEELWKLRNIMRDYSDVTPKYMDPRDVFNDPRWHKVVECAKETLKSFEGYKVPTDERTTGKGDI